MQHVTNFFAEAGQICSMIEVTLIEALATELAALRERGGRLFILGVGGSAGNASHAVNDFRKLCGIETYAPIDNVSELTARTNDEGWDTVFAAWLEISKLNERDAILIFSVGGGDVERNISPNIVKAIDLAKARNAKVFGIVGRCDRLYRACRRRHRRGSGGQPGPGHSAIGSVPGSGLAFLVSHPALQVKKTKW